MKLLSSTNNCSHGITRPLLGLLLMQIFFFVQSSDAATLKGRLEIAGQLGSGHHDVVQKGRHSKEGNHKKSPVGEVTVTLYEATEFAPIALASTATSKNGDFQFNIGKNTSNSIFFS